MNTFVEAIDNQVSRTENGMKAFEQTSNACVSLFYKVGASRGQDIIPAFVKAYVENQELACRIMLWARDIRGGSGERQLFKDVISYMEINNPDVAIALINKIPELGRWDDMFISYKTPEVEKHVLRVCAAALDEGNGLLAKWCPRKGVWAKKLRDHLRLSPKQYRKKIVGLTKVVEQQMCNKEWNSIDFSKVPSLAHSRYRKAFFRNCEDRYNEYIEKLTAGNKSVKINAGAVYPHDVIKTILNNYYNNILRLSKTEQDSIIAQWDALPDYMNDGHILPMIDVSGSMTATVGGNNNITCMDVAVSLGLYCADKNKGTFKDVFLTFSSNSKLQKVKGNIVEKVLQTVRSDWGMSTNLHNAFNVVLETAVSNKVKAEDMPKMILIFSDMQFNSCVKFDDSAMQMIYRKYEEAGYEIPKIVFWNLRACDNVPVKANDRGVALVSGFSPSILKSLLAGDIESFTPYNIMLKTIMNERYNL